MNDEWFKPRNILGEPGFCVIVMAVLI